MRCSSHRVHAEVRAAAIFCSSVTTPRNLPHTPGPSLTAKSKCSRSLHTLTLQKTEWAEGRLRAGEHCQLQPSCLPPARTCLAPALRLQTVPAVSVWPLLSHRLYTRDRPARAQRGPGPGTDDRLACPPRRGKRPTMSLLRLSYFGIQSMLEPHEKVSCT